MSEVEASLPLISVCIPAFVHYEYALQAVESVLADPSKNFEVIVSEDFDHHPLAHEFESQIAHARLALTRDKRVCLIKGLGNSPIQDNWNATIRFAKGKFIKLLGADDRLLPLWCEQITPLLDGLLADRAYIAHCGDIIDERGKLLRSVSPYIKGCSGFFVAPSDIIYYKLRNIARAREPVFGFFTKAAWEEVGGYSRDYRFVFDIAFAHSVMQRYGGAFLNFGIVQIRRHSQSDGARLPARLAIDELSTLYNEWLNNISEGDRAHGRMLAASGIIYRRLEAGYQRKHFLKSLFQLFFDLLIGRASLRALPGALALLFRRLRQGDVQNTLQGFHLRCLEYYGR